MRHFFRNSFQTSVLALSLVAPAAPVAVGLAALSAAGAAMATSPAMTWEAPPELTGRTEVDAGLKSGALRPATEKDLESAWSHVRATYPGSTVDVAQKMAEFKKMPGAQQAQMLQMFVVVDKAWALPKALTMDAMVVVIVPKGAPSPAQKPHPLVLDENKPALCDDLLCATFR